MKTAQIVDEYIWGDDMSPDLRQRLETEVLEARKADPGFHQYPAEELKSIGNGQLFLLWLRA